MSYSRFMVIFAGASSINVIDILDQDPVKTQVYNLLKLIAFPGPNGIPGDPLPTLPTVYFGLDLLETYLTRHPAG